MHTHTHIQARQNSLKILPLKSRILCCALVSRARHLNRFNFVTFYLLSPSLLDFLTQTQAQLCNRACFNAAAYKFVEINFSMFYTIYLMHLSWIAFARHAGCGRISCHCHGKTLYKIKNECEWKENILLGMRVCFLSFFFWHRITWWLCFLLCFVHSAYLLCWCTGLVTADAGSFFSYFHTYVKFKYLIFNLQLQFLV